MRKIFLTILLTGTAVAPAISAAAQRPIHHVSSGQHQSSQRSRSTAPRGTSPHVTRGPSSQYSRPAAPGGAGQHATHGPSSHYSRPSATGGTSHYRPPPVSSTPHFGTQPPLRHEGHRSQPHWNNNWRYDHRYNWSDYRRHHHSRYHLGYYHDPFGWAYQAFAIGWRLWPNYYSSNFWINDPWAYRLPPPPPGTRWIRYYNDVLLVDTWTGEVIDVIHNFFW